MPCWHLASPTLETPAAFLHANALLVQAVQRKRETLKTLKPASSVRLESSALGVDFVVVADGLISRVFA